MTQNPYAQFGQPGQGGDFLDPMDRRTSVLAILALIAGLLCFLPGAGVLALILGGAAVIFISQSRGRLGGLGLAITGIVLGLLFSIFWVMLAIGAASANQLVNQHFIGPAQTVLTGLDTGDHQKARLLFTRTADAAITDAQLDKFAERVRAEWGKFNGGPQSLIDLVGDYAGMGQRMQGLQGRNDMIPTPMHFANGLTLALLEIDPAAAAAAKNGPAVQVAMPMVNLGVIAKNGTIMWLVEPEQAMKYLTPIGTPIGGKKGSTPPGTSEGAADPDAKEPPKAPETPASPD